MVLRWLLRVPRIPSVPRVSLLSQAITPPPRTVPKVKPAASTPVVLAAPPLGLTKAIVRGPSKSFWMAERSFVY